jgi:hypothetical protein
MNRRQQSNWQHKSIGASCNYLARRVANSWDLVLLVRVIGRRAAFDQLSAQRTPATPSLARCAPRCSFPLSKRRDRRCRALIVLAQLQTLMLQRRQLLADEIKCANDDFLGLQLSRCLRPTTTAKHVGVSTLRPARSSQTPRTSTEKMNLSSRIRTDTAESSSGLSLNESASLTHSSQYMHRMASPTVNCGSKQPHNNLVSTPAQPLFCCSFRQPARSSRPSRRPRWGSSCRARPSARACRC